MPTPGRTGRNPHGIVTQKFFGQSGPRYQPPPFCGWKVVAATRKFKMSIRDLLDILNIDLSLNTNLHIDTLIPQSIISILPTVLILYMCNLFSFFNYYLLYIMIIRVIMAVNSFVFVLDLIVNWM